MKESQIHQAFSKWLDVRGVPYVHSNTHRRSSTTVGDPDYVIGWCGKILFVEVKVLGGKLSPAQEQRIAFIRASGCRCEVCYSLEACVAAAESILCDHGQPGEELKQNGGDAKCAAPVRKQLDPVPSTTSTTAASTGAGQSNPEPAPKLYQVSGQLGQVVVRYEGNREIFVRIASALDQANLPHGKSDSEPAPNFRIAKILGTDWVIAPDQDGVWDRIRRASAADLVNFERVK